jgi:menaquinone-dependent protoporphyrinogen IX oxidase
VLIRLVARHKGLPTDASIDADLTDWDAVAEFAAELPALQQVESRARAMVRGSR